MVEATRHKHLEAADDSGGEHLNGTWTSEDKTLKTQLTNLDSSLQLQELQISFHICFAVFVQLNKA